MVFFPICVYVLVNIIKCIKEVMTFETYQNDTFCGMNVAKGSATDGCLQMPTHTFTPSLPSSAALSNTLTLTQTMSVLNWTQSKSFTVSFAGTSLAYIETVLVFYDYTVVEHTIIHSYYFSFFTIFYPSDSLLEAL